MALRMFHQGPVARFLHVQMGMIQFQGLTEDFDTGKGSMNNEQWKVYQKSVEVANCPMLVLSAMPNTPCFVPCRKSCNRCDDPLGQTIRRIRSTVFAPAEKDFETWEWIRVGVIIC